jgi:hypothetical protein
VRCDGMWSSSTTVQIRCVSVKRYLRTVTHVTFPGTYLPPPPEVPCPYSTYVVEYGYPGAWCLVPAPSPAPLPRSGEATGEATATGEGTDEGTGDGTSERAHSLLTHM